MPRTGSKSVAEALRLATDLSVYHHCRLCGEQMEIPPGTDVVVTNDPFAAEPERKKLDGVTLLLRNAADLDRSLAENLRGTGLKFQDLMRDIDSYLSILQFRGIPYSAINVVDRDDEWLQLADQFPRTTPSYWDTTSPFPKI